MKHRRTQRSYQLRRNAALDPMEQSLQAVQAEVELSSQRHLKRLRLDDLLGVRECLYLQARLLSSAPEGKRETSERCLLVIEELQHNRHYQPSSPAAAPSALSEDLAAFKDCFPDKYC